MFRARVEQELEDLARSLGSLDVDLSNAKRAPGCLGYIGDYTTQLCGDYNKPM